jgi:hypothetical protein
VFVAGQRSNIKLKKLFLKEEIMEKLVVIINGFGGSGKDTLCEVICKHYKATIISSITPVKEIASKHGWDGSKDIRSRRFLSELKRAFINYNDLPYKYLMSEYKKFLESDKEIMFAHIRESDQILQFINGVGSNCITLLIQKNKKLGDQNRYGNYSDDNVTDYNYDFYYNNDKSLDELEEDFLKFFNNMLTESGFLHNLRE